MRHTIVPRGATLVVAALLAAHLVGCGGGGGDDATPPPAGTVGPAGATITVLSPLTISANATATAAGAPAEAARIRRSSWYSSIVSVRSREYLDVGLSTNPTAAT